MEAQLSRDNGTDAHRYGRRRIHPIIVKCSRCAAVLGFRKPGGEGTWCCRACRVDIVIDLDLASAITPTLDNPDPYPVE